MGKIMNMRSLMVLPFMLLLWSPWTFGNDQFGDDTSTATNSPKLVDASEQDEDFDVNEEVTLYCYFISKQPFDVKWYKNDQEIQLTTGVRYNFSENKQVLSIPKGRMSDKGKYRCKGSNQYGGDSHNITVTMHLPPCGKKTPKVYSPQPTVTVKKGEKVTLVCVVKFKDCQTSLPTFEWRNSKGHLVVKGSYTKVVASIGGTRRVMILTKKHANKCDSGTYECIVHSVRTKSTSTVQLNVV